MKAAEAKSTTATASNSMTFFSKGSGKSMFNPGQVESTFFNSGRQSDLPVQAKLTVGKPNDKFEQEADSAADKVVNGNERSSNIENRNHNHLQRSIFASPLSYTSQLTVSSSVQKKCASCEEEEKVQKKEKEEESLNTRLQKKPIFESNAEPSEDETGIQRKCAECESEQVQKLQTKADGISSSSRPVSIEGSLASSKGSGNPLPAQTKTQMESSFGADFSGVRIHNNSQSAQMSSALHAQAFTHGSDIYFNSGKYDTNSKGGRHLLAHELTHTVQQGGSSINKKADHNISGHNSDSAGAQVQLKLTAEGDTIQRSVVDDALTFAGSLTDCITFDIDEAKRCGKQKAQQVALHIPGYRALRVVLGSDPITGEVIERNGKNFIEAAFDIIPGGLLIHQKLTELNQLEAAAVWIDARIASITAIVSMLFGELNSFWSGLGISDFTSPMNVIRRGANIVLGFISRVVSFAVEAGTEFLKMIKDFLLAKIVDFIKEQTPAYPLLTVILGKDPITDAVVERNGTNILNALLELGGEEGIAQRTQMQETGTFERVAGFIDEGIAVFAGAYEQIKQGFSNIWNVVTIGNLIDPVGTFNLIYNQFSQPLIDIWAFVSRVGAVILQFIKEVLMRRLAEWAKTVRGYTLITVIIGRDPFTGEVVPRTVENIIHGFMGLMEGGEAQFAQMQESGAIAQMTERVNAAVETLNMTPAAIVQMFIDLWNSFSLQDLANPIAAFQRIIERFGEPIAKLAAFAWEIIKIVIEVILRMMNFPFALINNIITKALEAIELIKRDPIGFLKNILRAIKQGFIQFFDNIVQHLLQGLVGWLASELRDAGVPELNDLSLRGVISWTLEVLGISMEVIWRKLAEHPRIGPERVARIRSMINTLEGIWTFIKDVQERGIVAIWERIQEQLSNLWDTILNSVKNWIMERIITAVVTKLLSMLDPTGIMAVINSAIAIYNAVQSFIKYLREMLEIINSFVEGVAEIAAGNIQKAADYLERTMARGIPIVIGFLANQVGLGGIGRRIGELIGSARELVDRALTWLVNKAVDTGMALLDRVMAMGRSAAGAVLGWLGLKKEFTLPNGEKHELYFQGSEQSPQVIVASKRPRGLELLVSERRSSTTAPALTPVQDSALSLALTNKTDLDNFINANKSSNAAGGTSTVNLEAGINTRLDTIKQNLIDGDAIPVTPELPLSNVTYSMEGNKAKSVIAKPLTKLPGNTSGSPPVQDDSTPPGWHHIRAIEGARITGWVKAHLLNENLHGPGVNWNLVPSSQRFNSAMRVGSEKWAKDEIAKDEIIHYKAEVTSYHQDNSNPSIQDYFAKTVNVTYGYMVNPAKGRNAETSIVSSYTNDDPPTGTTTGPPSINTMTRENIRSMFEGVINVDKIYEVRNSLPNSAFRDLAHMYLRLRDAYNQSSDFETVSWPIISQKYNFQNTFKF